MNVTSQLKELSKTIARVILLFANSQDASVVYRDLAGVSLTGEGYVWIVGEQALDSGTKAPLGTISCELVQRSAVKSHLNDAILVASTAMESLFNEGLLDDSFLDNGCHSTSPWSGGKNVYRKLLDTTIVNGETGHVTFDESGDRIMEEYRIVNVQQSGRLDVGHFHNNTLSMNNTIIWPGGSSEKPQGTFRSRHLRIVTIEGPPFVYVDSMPINGSCSALNDGEKEYIECFGRNFADVHAYDHQESENDMHCCSGFCIGLLILLSKKINFTYNVHLSEDAQFGSHVTVPGETTRRWNGMVGEIVDDKADLIVAALTISNDRAKCIEFSKPFKYQGITILVKKNQSPSSLDSFLRPFQIELWLLVLLSVHVVAVILYLLDRFSPFGRFQLARSDKEETPLNLSSAMWFSWGVLLNSGIGEGTPRSFSARVLGMVWAGFAMIIVASYTANLAAFLVLDRPRAVVTGIDDPNLRNPSDNFKYATVANSSVSDYFRRQVELSNMYTSMVKHDVASAREGVDAVKNGDLKAFIWDSAVLYHEASKDCSVTTAGELFGRSGYGIGLPNGSVWTDEISLAVLNFHESGKMEGLESLWVDIGQCPETSNAPTTLGLSHMLGVFIMVLAGIGAGIIIIILEIIYHKHRGWRADQRDLAKKTTQMWKNNVMMTKNGRSNHGNGINGITNDTTTKPMENSISQESRVNPIFDDHTF